MVSARVLNPVVLSEFCKMSASPAVSRNLPCGSQLKRIKRDLFGSAQVNIKDTKTPFNADLERKQELATQKWGFDFRSGCPLAGKSAFMWERVSFQESSFAPEMYTLTRAAHVAPRSESPASEMDVLMNERAERENYGSNLVNSSLESNTDNDSCYDSQDESLLVHFTSTSATATSLIATRKRQPKITEFMKERKRLAQAPKKLSPVKRLRTSSSSSSSVSSNLGLAAHFGSMLKRPRHN